MVIVMRTRIFPWWPPLFIIGAAALYLAVRWDAIPDTWISHWGAGGRPNGWSHKSVAGVFGPLFLAALPMLVLEVVNWVVGTRRERPELDELIAATQTLIRMLGNSIVLMISLVAVLLPFGGFDLHIGAIGVLGIFVLVVLIGLRRVVGATADLAKKKRLKGYESGLFYSNPDDERLVVPKLLGIGWTINFAHRWAWPLLIGLLAAPLCIVIVARLAIRP
jgi:uncharacterized membrane protein